MAFNSEQECQSFIDRHTHGYYLTRTKCPLTGNQCDKDCLLYIHPTAKQTDHNICPSGWKIAGNRCGHSFADYLGDNSIAWY